MRVGHAALAGDGVDALHVVGAHLVERLVGERDDVALAHSRLERLGDHLVDAVHHRRRHVEQDDLVDVLDLPRVEHGLLAVAHFQSRLLQREDERQFRDVQADGHAGHALLLEDGFDLAGSALEQPHFWGHRAAQAHHPRQAMVLGQPGRVETVMHGGGPEVPQPGLAVASEERETAHLVARPLADHSAGEIADVVVVEAEDRAQPRALQRLARAGESVVVQAGEIDPLLEVHAGMARRRDLPAPVVAGLERLALQHHVARDGLWLAGHVQLPGRVSANDCTLSHSTGGTPGSNAVDSI